MAKKSSKPLTPFNKFLIKWVFPWTFTIIGILVLYFGSLNLIEANASTKWPTSDGVIISSIVKSHRSSGKNHNKTNYSAEIEYEFKLEDKIYIGTRIAFGEFGSGNPLRAEEIVGSYPKDLKVLVYYNRENPNESILEPGIKGKTWLLFGAGLIFFSFGCVMMVMFSINPIK